MITEYEVNGNTLAIIPINNKRVKVYEVDNVFEVEDNIMNIINDSCRYFGSNYSGRLAFTKELINVTVKAPIVIEESREIIFFPFSSPRLDSCGWISYNHISRYLKLDKETVIFFDKGDPLKVKISYNIIDNQMTRSMKLHMNFIERKKKIRKELKNN